LAVECESAVLFNPVPVGEPELLAAVVEDIGGAGAHAAHDDLQRQCRMARAQRTEFLAEAIAP
jgi:hypothetical protein